MQNYKFNDLVKQAAAKTLTEILRTAKQTADKGGVLAGLKYLEKYRSPLHILPKNLEQSLKNKPLYELGSRTKNKFRGILQQELGNMAHGITRLTQNVSTNQPITTSAANLTKNFFNILRDQIRGTKYKVVSPDKVKVIDGRKVVPGEGLFKFRMFDRPVVGKTTAGNVIIKKRKATIPIALAVSPVGFGAMEFVGSNKNDSVVSRSGKALKETALWSLASPVAQAKLLYNIVQN